MASIESRSRYFIAVQNRDDLTKTFASNREAALKQYIADLLARYLREESPRHKGFEVEGYIINAMLTDAGLPRVDLAEAMTAHKNPHPCHAAKNFSCRKGKSVRLPAPTTCFIRKPFADVVPEDIDDYIDDRCQAVGQDTVDREVDLFSAVCNIAIDTWRIPVAKSPMDGVRRPRYFNEWDRRLEGDEEERLLNAAFDEDAEKGVEARLEELMAEERARSLGASAGYARKNIVKEARRHHLPGAQVLWSCES